MLRRLILCLTLLVACGGGGQWDSNEYIFLTGKVVDHQGQPVAGATVNFFPFAANIGPRPYATTDTSGSFSLKTPPVGEGTLSASKLEDGYPDMTNALYGGRNSSSRVRVDANATKSSAPVILRFETPNALLRWKIVSSSTQLTIRGAYMHISLVDDPGVEEFGSFPVDRDFVFVLPRQAVTLMISSQGFQEWHPSDSPGLAQPLLLPPGTVDKRVILLKPK